MLVVDQVPWRPCGARAPVSRAPGGWDDTAPQEAWTSLFTEGAHTCCAALPAWHLDHAAKAQKACARACAFGRPWPV